MILETLDLLVNGFVSHLALFWHLLVLPPMPGESVKNMTNCIVFSGWRIHVYGKVVIEDVPWLTIQIYYSLGWIHTKLLIGFTNYIQGRHHIYVIGSKKVLYFIYFYFILLAHWQNVKKQSQSQLFLKTLFYSQNILQEQTLIMGK